MRSARMLIWTCLFVLGAGLLCGAQEQAPKKYLKRFQVQLPIEPMRVSSFMLRWQKEAGIAVGVEDMLPPPPDMKREQAAQQGGGRIVSSLDLSFMEVNEALAILADHLPNYRITNYGDMLVARRRDGTTLDRKAEHFVLNNATYLEAIQAVRRIYDPTWTAPDRPMEIRPGVQINPWAQRNADEFNLRFTGSITLDLSNVTVEQILNEIARKLPGGATWIIRYASQDMEIMRATITLLQPDGTQVHFGWVPMKTVTK